MNETAVTFECDGDPLVGILHRPPQAKNVGVVIVVGGGPQYRAGGHRQLSLWSRRLATAGYPVLRFDYRGMGDSYGTFTGFENIDDDIRAAVDRLVTEYPEVDHVVLWGECDGAAAILYYAYRDPRIKRAVLLNPWARTEALRAKAVLHHYYLHRLLEASFWRKVLSLRFNPVASLGSAWSIFMRARKTTQDRVERATDPTAPLSRALPLPERLLTGFTRFGGRTMLVMSGRDLIAREFDELVSSSATWRDLLRSKGTVRHDLVEADHTFSTATWRDQVIDWAVQWLAQTDPRP